MVFPSGALLFPKVYMRHEPIMVHEPQRSQCETNQLDEEVVWGRMEDVLGSDDGVGWQVAHQKGIATLGNFGWQGSRNCLVG